MSDLVVTLEEGSSSGSVMCTAEAYPEASYAWEVSLSLSVAVALPPISESSKAVTSKWQQTFQVAGGVVATDNLLFFDGGVSREQGGDYTCVARNRHGRADVVTRIEVTCEWEREGRERRGEGSKKSLNVIVGKRKRK